MPPGGGWLRDPGPPVGVLQSAAHRRAESRFWGIFIIAASRRVLGVTGVVSESRVYTLHRASLC